MFRPLTFIIIFFFLFFFSLQLWSPGGRWYKRTKKTAEGSIHFWVCKLNSHNWLISLQFLFFNYGEHKGIKKCLQRWLTYLLSHHTNQTKWINPRIQAMHLIYTWTDIAPHFLLLFFSNLKVPLFSHCGLAGMQHVVECICVGPAEKRYYLCTLCKLTFATNTIIKHVLSFDHIFCYFVSSHMTDILRAGLISTDEVFFTEAFSEALRQWELLRNLGLTRWPGIDLLNMNVLFCFGVWDKQKIGKYEWHPTKETHTHIHIHTPRGCQVFPKRWKTGKLRTKQEHVWSSQKW